MGVYGGVSPMCIFPSRNPFKALKSVRRLVESTCATAIAEIMDVRSTFEANPGDFGAFCNGDCVPTEVFMCSPIVALMRQMSSV